MAVDVVNYIYAAIVAAGGIFGYVKAQSIPSLIAGLVFGVIIAGGAYLNSQSPPKPILSLVAALALALMMSFRWYKSGNFMPAGLISVISYAAIVYTVIMFNRHLPFVGRGDP